MQPNPNKETQKAVWLLVEKGWRAGWPPAMAQMAGESLAEMAVRAPQDLCDSRMVNRWTFGRPRPESHS